MKFTAYLLRRTHRENKTVAILLDCVTYSKTIITDDGDQYASLGSAVGINGGQATVAAVDGCVL